MTLVQLRYFCAAARYHSITQAANALYVTQPTISIAIRGLEKEFSLTLFYHSGNQVFLTEEGEKFYQKASQILSTCDDLRGEYSRKETTRHNVRLGIPPLLSSVFFPEMLDSFHVDYPDTWIELQEYGSIRACTLVQDEVLDIGLVNMELPNIDKFNTMELMQDPVVFCVCANHPFARMEELELSALDRQPVILLTRDSVHNHLMQTRFSVLGITPRIIMHSSQVMTILNFLRQGRCGCFLYKRMLPQFPELIGIPLKGEMNTRIGLVWKKGRYTTKGMTEFLDFCRKYYVEKGK